MKLSSVSIIRIYIILFLIILCTIIYEVYRQIMNIKNQRHQLLYSFYDENLDNITYVDAMETKFIEKRSIMVNIIRIKAQIKAINTRQRIFNEFQLRPVKQRTYVIVIQVHSNIVYLRSLLESLMSVNAIKKSLLIFSHDYFDDEINNLIKNITFKIYNYKIYLKYTQIFYPFSIQLHPEIFPGADNNLCTDEFDCLKSNIRDPDAAQSKNHWWWQMNHIFDHLEVTKNYNGTIMFIEEDNYVTEDLIFIFQLLQAIREESCPDCEIISLAANAPSLAQYHVHDDVVSIRPWDNTVSKTGIAFDRRVWNIIKGSSYDFCYFNDFNWDNSLKHVAEKRQGKFWVVAIEAPRVFHFEKCDDDNPSCKNEYKINEVKKFVRMITRALYPGNIMLKIMDDNDYNATAVGYFGDVRDKELCMYFSKHEVLF